MASNCDDTAKPKPRGRPFEKGHAPLPGGGRPPKDIRLRASRYDEQALKRIAALIPDERLGLAAAREILDRAHGKPKQTIANEIDQEELEAMFSRWGLALRKVLVPAFGDKRAAELMADIKRKYDDLKGGDSDGD
jgi:hypothetical protein